MNDPALASEHFGPVVLFVICRDNAQMAEAVNRMEGQLSGVFYSEPEDWKDMERVYLAIRQKAGRLIWNGVPTGVEVCRAMHHGGPYPATTFPSTTSVGMMAVKRFLRPVAYQNFPDQALPPALRDGNPLGIMRLVDGVYER